MSSDWNLKSRIKSFKYALNGIGLMFKNNPNFLIQLSIAIIALLFSIIFNISKIEWIAVLILIALVLSAEIFNSSIENLSDFVSTEKHDKIKHTKDLAAAAVLILSIFSAIIGLIIFIPKFLNFINA